MTKIILNHRRTCTKPRETIHVRMLPQYSPFLNIVEDAIRCLETKVKDRNAARNAQLLPLGEYRKQLFVETIERKMGSINGLNVQLWYRHMQTDLPGYLRREKIYRINTARGPMLYSFEIHLIGFHIFVVICVI